MPIPRSACLLLCLIPYSEPVITAQAPTEAEPLRFAKSPRADDYSKEPYVYELIQTKARFDADGKSQRELTVRVRIQSESAVRELGLLTYPFASSFETLDVVYVRVIKPDGAVVETPPSDVQELDSPVSREAPMYSDKREKHVAVKSLAVGDVLEIDVRWTMHDAITPGYFWFDDSYFRTGICLKETLQLDLPRGVAAKVDYKEPKPKIEESGDRRIFTFETAHLKKNEESKIPEWEKDFYGMAPPEVRVSSFTSWADVGTWFRSLEEPKTAVTPEIRAKADELTKGLNSEDEKIQALYNFVSTHFRYIGVDLGIGRYAPHAAADVLANRYGDCKDKHTLFAALLKSVGISAYPVLISSRFRLDPSFSSPDLFDHVITAIPKGDAFVFLDTTPEIAPFGLLLANLRDRQALVVPNSSPAKLAKTPADPPFRPYVTLTIDSSIDTEGTLDAKMRIEERGDGEIELRTAYRNTPQNRWDELTQVLVNRMGYAGKSSDVSVSAPEDTAKPFVISLQYHRPEFPDWKNHQISFPAPPLVLADLNDDQKRSKSALPLGASQDLTYQVTVKLPKDYSADAPANVSRKTDFAEFSAQYSCKDGVLQGTLHWKTLLRQVPAGERDQYTELAKSVADAQSRYIPVTGGIPIPVLVSPNLSASTRNRLGEAIPQLEKIVSDQPENETAARMLADAYVRVGRAKDGVALLEKGVAKAPQDPWLMTSLGEAYLKVPDVDKAMAQFKKAIDVNPDPMVLNQVAYALADSKSRSSEAESYSKQALKRLSEQSMEIDAEEADKDDFVLMSKLAMNWDTLGWIKFQMGDVESAEKYVVASWQLVQDPAVGEHLVEIYEKRGKPQQAALICAMAQAAYRHEEVQEKLEEDMKRLKPYLPAKNRTASDGAMALSEMRTMHVTFQTKLPDKSRWMHVVIAMTAGEKRAQIAYVSGAEELQKANDLLAKLKYPQDFPDATRVRVVRKAVFSCSIYTKDCTIVLAPTWDSAAGN
jgi:tetratricopeptide (TPR) repeat protein